MELQELETKIGELTNLLKETVAQLDIEKAKGMRQK